MEILWPCSDTHTGKALHFYRAEQRRILSTKHAVLYTTSLSNFHINMEPMNRVT